jgi:phage-related protein
MADYNLGTARGTIELRYESDTAERARRDIDDVGDSAERTGSKMSKFGALAATGIAALGAGLISVGPEILKTGALLEQIASKSKIVFGDSVGIVETWAAKSAAAMGITSTQAIGLATNMGDLLIPMGFTREQAAKMSTDIVGLSGALAEWTGGTKSASEVADILTAAMLGETDGLTALGISLSADEIAAELAAKGQDKLTGAALNQATAQAVQNLVLAKSVDAQTAFAGGADSALRKQAELTAKFEEGKEALISALFPAFQAIVNFMVNDFIPALQNLGTFIDQNKVAIGVIAGIITAVFLPAIIAAGVQSTISAAAQVAAWVASSAAALASAGTMIAIAALTVARWVLMGVIALMSAAEMAAAWIIAMGPVGWVTALIIGLVALIIANWDTVKAATIAVWTAISDFVVGVWNAIVTWVSDAVNNVVNFITNAWNAVKAANETTWNGIKSTINSVWNAIWGFITGLVGNIVSFLSNAWNNIARTVSSAWNGIVNAVSTAIGNVLRYVSALPGRILSALGNLGNLLVNAGRDIVQGLWNGIAGMGAWLYNQIMGWIRSVVPGPILQFLGIASPSKFMRDEIGKMIPKGIMVGMEKETPDLLRTSQDLAATVAQGATPDPIDFSLAGATAAGMRAGIPPATRSTSTKTVHIASVTVQVQGNLDPTNPVGFRQTMERLRDEIRNVERATA